MHRSKTADALLTQMTTERHYDVVIISEQYKRKQSGIWIEDKSGTVAAWLPPSSKIATPGRGIGNGFVWTKCDLCTIISCYLTTSHNIQDFQAKLDSIEDTARDIGEDFIIAGDFNSKAIEWGMRNTDSRGKRVLDMAARLGAMVLNTGAATTFRRPGCEETTPDITLASERIASIVKRWEVMEDYTGSDHQYITFEIDPQNTVTQNNLHGTTRNWNVSKLNSDAHISEIDKQDLPKYDIGDVRENVQNTMRLITQACRKGMPRSQSRRQKRAAYWWTENIAQLRRACLHLRRVYTRNRRRGNATTEMYNLHAAKKELMRAIEISKKAK